MEWVPASHTVCLTVCEHVVTLAVSRREEQEWYTDLSRPLAGLDRGVVDRLHRFGETAVVAFVSVPVPGIPV